MTKLAPAAAAADSVGSVSSNRFGNYSATVLALTTSAVGSQAAIVYTNPTDVVLGVNENIGVDFINREFVAGGALTVDYFNPNYVQLFFAGGNSLAFDGRLDVDPPGPGPVNLTRFTLTQPIGAAGGAAGWNEGPGYASYANFNNEPGFAWNPPSGSVTGYVGVRLDNIGEGNVNYYYGWLRMTYDKDAQTLTLHDFAYQSTQNVAINAGAVPEPAETGLLAALGAGGLATWRKLRQKRRSTAA